MNFSIDRTAFRIFGLDIMWYGILIGIGILLGTLVMLREVRRKSISEDLVINMLLLAIPAGIIGARLYYVIFSWEYYQASPISIFNIREGGLAIHGGLLAGSFTAYLFARYKKINFFDLADSAAPGIALGQSIGRWGNFINQEAYGRPTNLPWSILVDGQRVHPTFFYESIGDIAIFVFLYWFARKKQTQKGQIIFLYMILYGLLRFIVESFRIDSLMFLDFRVAQLISLAFILFGIFGFHLIRKKLI